MVVVSRTFPNILTDDIAATRDFYVDLLGLHVAFDSDWFVNLRSEESPACELGVWRRDHELIPADFRHAPAGTVVSFIVDDVDAVHDDAVSRGLAIVEPPRDLFYGQRQLMLADPNGMLIDVSTPVEMSEEFASSLVEDGGTYRQRRSGKSS